MAPKCVPSGSRREMAVFPVFLGPVSGTFEMTDGSDQVKSSRSKVGNATEKETCNPEPCPVDCKFSSCRPQSTFSLLFLCCFFAAPGGSLGEIAPPVVVWDNVSAHALGMPRVRFQTAGGSFYVQLR